jgi:hypothetical protein
MKIQDIKKEELALKFSQLLLECIGIENMKMVNHLNELTGYNYSICHSHDYCDANQIMLDTIEKLIGTYDFDFNDCECINEAWHMAKLNNFYI